MRLLLATRNAHKAAEVVRILAREARAGRGPIEVFTLDQAGIPRSDAEDDLEPFETFEENAASKARHFAQLSGLVTVADDSGLAVDALGGRPGVRTKRFAPRERYPGLGQDEANNRHLVERLNGLPPAMRSARYVCVACLLDPDSGGPIHFRGEGPGRILTEGRGTGGFGYDPIFLDVELGRSYAELTSAEKDARSHRGKAFRALAAFLEGRAVDEAVVHPVDAEHNPAH